MSASRSDFDEKTALVRRDLAAAYRLIAHFQMDDSIFTHISARIPGPDEHFLINAYGLRFDEIKASNLVTVDLDGNIVSDPEKLGFNPAGFTIHSAVHAARPDVGAVLHTHTVAGVAVSCLEAGLMPLNQWSLQFHDRIAYHGYEGIALDLAERVRIVADLGDKRVMILRNHGLLTAGRSVAETFKLMFNMERSCKAQIAATSSGQKLMFPHEKMWELTARQYESYYDAVEAREIADIEWNSYLRLLDRAHAGFAD
jgi:ribulose-5-phosphate 4-epimerase/fuculose-1-phosphate aldolase